ncbi:MAG: aromatic ring-hydroxylating dioxygenase subunit alpha [Flavobacteriales bacterium]|nr:aromatic ring-hydroxylating dioxygenase subunit alpha [Flavobacteriales bacterium]
MKLSELKQNYISRDKFDDHIKYMDEADFNKGPSLPMWTYANKELLELEYEECFLKTWQFAGHESDLQNPGDYIVFDMWRDSAIIMVDDDGKINAFQNVCSHRASRLLDGKGCTKLIQCHYHAWTFNRDGSCKGITQPKGYPDCDKSELGLEKVEVEVYRSMVFVKMKESDCLSVAEQWAPIDEFIAPYNTDDYERIDGSFGQDWKCNWKLAKDNYDENYHVPTGHPGLQRMTEVGEEGGECETGVGFGTFRMRIKASKAPNEARYQALIHTSDHRVEHPVKRLWFQVTMHHNMGIEFNNEALWVFQILPKGVDKTEIRYSLFGRKNMSDHERELTDLNIKINSQVNDEDKFLVERIQKGALTSNYEPGQLSYAESSVALTHKRLKERFPVCSLEKSPRIGKLKEVNDRMKQ